MAFEIEKANGASKDFFAFKNVGDTLTGVFIGKYDDEGDFGPRENYIFKTDKGNKIVTGSKDFNDQMRTTDEETGETALRPLGQLLRITFTHEKPSKRGKPLKKFQFERDPSYVHDDADEVGAFEAEDETPLDEVKTAPVRKVLGGAPSASRQARVGALLAKKSG